VLELLGDRVGTFFTQRDLRFLSAPLLASIGTAAKNITIDLSQRRLPMTAVMWEVGVQKRPHHVASVPIIEALFSVVYNRDILQASSEAHLHHHMIDLVA